MPMEKFIFDGPNKQFVARPEFVDTDGEMVIDVQVDLYSAWKDVVRESDNLKFLEAMRTVGGDPISASQSLGATFFLTNGWRILPDAQDHRLIITGNIFTDPFGDSITDFPVSGVILIENTVSNLVDSSVARLDLTQLLPAVFIDADDGDDTAAGIPTAPVKTVAAARIIADIDNLKEYHFKGGITLDQNHLGWNFIGTSAEGNDSIAMSGFNVDKSRFEGCALTGIMDGIIEAINCTLSLTAGIDGIFRNCGLPNNFNIGDYAAVIMEDCFSEIPGSDTPSISFGTNAELSMRGFKGGIKLQDFNTGGFSSTIDLTSGHVIIDPSCTAGTIVVRGVGQITDNNGGTTVIKTGLVEGNDARIAREYSQNAIHIDTVSGNDTGNGSWSSPVQTITAARILADSINIRVYAIHGPITLNQDHDRWTIVGHSAGFFDVVNLAGFSVDESKFEGLRLAGIGDNSQVETKDCELSNLSGCYGVFKASAFANNFFVDNDRASRQYLFDRCFSGIAGLIRPVLNFSNPALSEGFAHNVSLRHYAGGLNIRNMDAAHKVSLGMTSGTVEIEASNTAGIIVLRGIGEKIDNSTGTTVNDEMVHGSDTELSRKLLQNRTITDPATGKITVADDDGGALVEADIFEDAAGTTPYDNDSTKIERREKLE